MSEDYFHRFSVLLFLLFSFSNYSFSQTPLQTIRGSVIDQDTKSAIPGATVVIVDSDPMIGTATDNLGKFRLENLPIGYYDLKVSLVGYQPLILTQLLLESGKELVLDIKLKESIETLEAVVLTGKRIERESLGPVSVNTITQEEVLRFPGTFYDPSRLAMTFAGVASTDDQANNIAIRGNSPNNLSWRLEGLEIVNPNHTSNAGTFSDRPTQNGGGVSILSAQLLSTSHFMTGAFPSQYGNALSGVMDMRLRPGNNEQYEFTAQAGVVGIDLAAEGPFSKNTNGSFLINYRYSFIGLLTDLGVELGDEDIRFQDLSFNVNLPTKKAGTFTLLGINGRSSNAFYTQLDTSLWEVQKDRFDIIFESDMSAFGITHTIPTGEKTSWSSALIFSDRNTIRTAYEYDDDLVRSEASFDQIAEQKTAFSTKVNYKVNPNSRLVAGIYITESNTDVYSIDNETDINFDGIDNSVLFQPYINFQQALAANKVQLNLGLHYQSFSLNDSQSLEPRASIKYNLSPKQSLSLAYGLHSKTQLAQLYFANSPTLSNENLGFTKAHHYVFSYDRKINSSTSIKAEAYYQSIFDVPIEDDPNSSFSALNLLEGFVLTDLVNEGTGENYGLELAMQKNFSNNTFFLINASYFDSKYTGGDGIKRDTRFNSNYILNVTAGKEFRWNKKGKEKVFGVNGRMAYYGGFRETPIDEAASIAAGETIFVESEAFSIKQPDFFKIDLRLYLKNNKKKYSSTLSLDIQNATNHENVAYSYYDPQQGEIIVKNQLGLIPILSYRIEF